MLALVGNGVVSPPEVVLQMRDDSVVVMVNPLWNVFGPYWSATIFWRYRDPAALRTKRPTGLLHSWKCIGVREER